MQQATGQLLVPLPHRRALPIRHVGPLASLRHTAARSCTPTRSCRLRSSRDLGRAHRQDDAERHRADQGQLGELDQPTTSTAGYSDRQRRCHGLGLDGRQYRSRGSLSVGEPEPDSAQTPKLTEGVAGHFGSKGRRPLLGNRPEILFDPSSGRPAFQMLRPHFGRRPPFAQSALGRAMAR